MKTDKKQIRQLKVSTYIEEEDDAIEASPLVTRKSRKKVAAETSSDPQIVVQTVAAESVIDQEVDVVNENTALETAKSITRELGTSSAHLVEKKTTKDAQKVL